MIERELVAAVAAAEDISRELDEDYVGLWKLAWHIRRRIPDVTDDRVATLAMGILRGLHDSAVQIGSLSEESGVFTPWPAEDAISRVLNEWRALGRDPNIGDIAWLARER